MKTFDPKQVRVRYAPSPTGDFHVGGARTALFNYLFAKHHGGKFILRIEDTDRTRYNPQSVGRLLGGLKFLGLHWDEGPDIGGPYGPYVQSERLEMYGSYCQELIENGSAYRCFCSQERLRSLSGERTGSKSSGYDRRCRDITVKDADRRATAGEPYTVRLKLPLDGEIIVRDAVRGPITFQNVDLQDTIIMKSDGIPTYHLANVVDDHHMKITHVLRGDEWKTSFPLHIYLYDAFGWQPPVMAHLPLILNPSGKGKMSKREGRAPDGRLQPVFVHTFEKLGYLPEALINYLALLGWSLDDKTEIMRKDELIGRFSLERVRPSPAAWDYNKLTYFNRVYIRGLSPEELTRRLIPFLAAEGINAVPETLLRITPLIQKRLNLLSDVTSWVDFFFMEQLPDYDPSLLLPKKLTLTDTIAILKHLRRVLADTDFDHDSLEAILGAAVRDLGHEPKEIFHSLRVAVCAKQVTPPFPGVLEILGKDITLNRLENALTKLTGES